MADAATSDPIKADPPIPAEVPGAAASPVDVPPVTTGWRARYPALTYPNYRLWFAGQMTSLMGTWMQSTAQGFLVFQLTNSPAYLGYVSFAGGIPTWLFTLYGGVVADRVPRRTLMIVTQTTMMILAFILSALTFLNLVRPWHIVVLAFLLGVANAFDAPARQAFTLELVDRQDLANAIALNATMFNSATAVGPAIAGFTYALAGPAWCFFINAVSFIAVILALWRMQLKPFIKPARRGSTLSELGDGLRFAFRHPVVRAILIIICIFSFFAMSFATLLPAWAVEVLGGDASTNGLMQSARGAGALISALTIASLGRFTYKGKLLTVGTFAMPIMLLIFSQVRHVPMSLLILIMVGMAQIPIMNLANALVQTQVPDTMRGRVMGIYTLLFMGMMPLGGLWAGSLAERLNEPAVVILGAAIALTTATVVYLFFPQVRRLE